MDLVAAAADSLEKNAAGCIAAINSGTHPFSGGEHEFYTFIYDTTATMVAHPNPELIGVNLADKPDAHGKLFRKEIVQTALDAGSGWTTYVYTIPDEEGLHDKKTYGLLVSGSDEVQYVVCAGMYLD
ncbi:MAG: cache domain-containing protein [Candidatus Cloacimonetes bacterium]|nr:cache domain-containing protein [Candidatus Cloacimonadota bacterium]